MVTIKDIAKEANVSVTTVSNVIHNRTSRVSEKTIKKVQGILKKYNYIPNMSARSLVNNNSMLIGVLFYTSNDQGGNLFEDPFNTELLSGIDEISKLHGYYIIVRSVSSIEEIQQIWNTWKVDGIIVLGLVPNELGRLEGMNRSPVVFIDTYPEENESVVHLSVGINDFEGSKMATEHLIENGHENIGFVSYKMMTGGVIEQRYQGFLKAISDYNLKKNEENIFQYIEESESLGSFFSKIIARKNSFTGLVFTADNLAIEAMLFFKKRGLHIPNDISIVGFDNIMAAKIISPSLTSVNQDIRLKGKKAVLMLIESIENGIKGSKKEEIPVDLIERRSVKRIK